MHSERVPVTYERTLIDFSHPQPVTAEDIVAIEAMVNAEIRRNEDGITRVMPIEEAKVAGAMALFTKNTMTRCVSCRWASFQLNYAAVPTLLEPVTLAHSKSLPRAVLPQVFVESKL